jgi:predicted small secreted protein
MKRTLIFTLVALTSALLLTSCSATTGTDVDAKTLNYTHFKHMPLSKVHNLIYKAGQEDGWRMTEFKENQLIAEKTEGGQTKAVTIEFSQDSFNLSPTDSDLKDAIEEKLGL